MEVYHEKNPRKKRFQFWKVWAWGKFKGSKHGDGGLKKHCFGKKNYPKWQVRGSAVTEAFRLTCCVNLRACLTSLSGRSRSTTHTGITIADLSRVCVLRRLCSSSTLVNPPEKTTQPYRVHRSGCVYTQPTKDKDGCSAYKEWVAGRSVEQVHALGRERSEQRVVVDSVVGFVKKLAQVVLKGRDAGVLFEFERDLVIEGELFLRHLDLGLEAVVDRRGSEATHTVKHN